MDAIGNRWRCSRPSTYVVTLTDPFHLVSGTNDVSLALAIAAQAVAGTVFPFQGSHGFYLPRFGMQEESFWLKRDVIDSEDVEHLHRSCRSRICEREPRRQDLRG